MQQVNWRNFVCVLSASTSLLLAPAAFAGLIESSPELPPANAVYVVPDTCISVVCLENIQLSIVDVINNQIIGSDDVTVSDVDQTANVFVNNSGTPGAFISPISLTGQADITYLDRDTLSDSGTFDALLTSLNLSGSFTGVTGAHQVAEMLNPLQPSTGVTTVQQLSPTTWQVSSFFDVFAELSLDGGPFVPGPERSASLAPEPANYLPIGAGLAIIFVRLARSKRRTKYAIS